MQGHVQVGFRRRFKLGPSFTSVAPSLRRKTLNPISRELGSALTNPSARQGGGKSGIRNCKETSGSKQREKLQLCAGNRNDTSSDSTQGCARHKVLSQRSRNSHYKGTFRKRRSESSEHVQKHPRPAHRTHNDWCFSLSM